VYTYRLENSRRVVVDGVDTGTVLPEEEHTAQHETVHDALVGGKGLERLPEANTNGASLILKGLVDGGNLFGDVNVVGVQLANPAKILHRLTATVLEEEPTRRFLDPQGTGEEEAGRDKLDGKWNDPLLMVLGHVLFNTVLSKLG
jgi:hypothetical protein